ncbi:hypothetical protein A3742_08930 [Oleiphilus sp. HI0071]|nr:hypothetical protein [Oleiphilus sp. HI0080]KZY68910.1 hypothetical protein A3737_12535 [Oleiphilus sp. HI0065]KZY82643.1 hypothetical protein A3742_08930 [Oleiphilus sp. HI0071]KZY92638.1 hypothetical protein A3744_02785 [Oleiphilus sp. HI0073]KZZ44537.1 hypothetical protein A3758_14700 [Oleiphilus sp. HI0118]KZZ52988.1 hypothetical protein A3760_09755 [Oleiphilus sp. HI0122]KZZ75706.1 hypothetical protein A3767_03215 [Oleiphilus sp. HI0133]
MSQFIVGQEELLKRAGKAGYQRGIAAYQSNRIEKYHRKGNFVTAVVDGFDVELKHVGNIVDGHCSCPESDGFDFCHHCVELVLHGNHLSQQLLSLSKGPEKSRIFAYLLGLDKQVMAKHMLDLLEQMPEQFERFSLKATLSNEQIDFVKLKARVTELTRIDDKRNLFSQRQVKVFFSRINQLFAEFEQAEFEVYPKEGLKLVEYALARLTQLLQQVDDKWGFHEQPGKHLRHLYQRLFVLLEGRPLTLVKRFEKVYFADKFSLIGLDYECYLSAAEGAVALFRSRASALWAAQKVPQIKLPKAASAHASLPQLEDAWQWRKLAQQVVSLATPDYAKKQHVLWLQTLREELALSPMSWLNWLEEIESQHGCDYAFERALVALQKHPVNEAVAKKAIQLGFALNDAVALQRLANTNATAFIEWLSFADSEILESMPEALMLDLYRTVAAINPHEDPEERQYRALTQLADLLVKRYIAGLAMVLGQDERILIDQRVKISKLMDEAKDLASVLRLRQVLIPYLLSKKQNRSDDLAAEQLVLLRQNYEQQGLSQDEFDQFVASFDYMIRERSNFSRLVEKHRAAPH